MKREYVYPQTKAEETMTITMLCSSGSGGGITPSHDTSSSNGGDPQDAI